MIRLVLILLLIATEATAETGLEKMFSGFETCNIKDVYMDETGKIKADYLRNRRPYKKKDGVAYFHVKDTMYGIPVVDVAIPASTWCAYAVTFDAPIYKVRNILSIQFGSDFKPGKRSEVGEAPELITDTSNKNRTLWICSSPY